MTTPPIANKELVIQYLGQWPSFHDAEIVSLTFARGVPGYWPVIYLEIDIVGTCLIELEFQEVREYQLDGFNHQNVILDIRFDTNNEMIDCDIDTSYGLSGIITARCVIVKNFSPRM